MADDREREERRTELFERYGTEPSEANRNAIVESYIPLAEYFAARYKDRGVTQEDLRQAAKLALVRSVERYDPQREVGFATFAGRTIDGELKKYFRDKTWVVRVPRSLQERVLLVRRTVAELETSLGRSPTAAQIGETLDLDLDEVLEALDVQQNARPLSIDGASPSSSANQPIAEQLPVQDDGFEQTEVRMATQRLLSLVSEREQQILKLRFFEEKSQAEIAEVVGVSQMHVSRLLRSALETMRSESDQNLSG